MKEVVLKLMFVLMASILLAGCGAFGGKKEQAISPAKVEDRSMDRTESDADSGARTQGLEDDETMSAAALDDPDSPLSVRIIYFDYDSSTVRADSSETISAHAAYLAANPSTTVTLEGHADERGTREYNLALGERRGLSVRRHLVLLGASAGQVKTVSYGEERPIVDGHDEDSYALNRRVELVY
ncbi:MAG: peptidoglycan-associated lipoprotein Pal [Gammaproteobacteria bacterium]|nr:peptidoglycan-associated lipoprotein Pal [Gammaproteobacteria bacterium]